jgi:hypothetical protein
VLSLSTVEGPPANGGQIRAILVLVPCSQPNGRTQDVVRDGKRRAQRHRHAAHLQQAQWHTYVYNNTSWGSSGEVPAARQANTHQARRALGMPLSHVTMLQ